MLGGTSAGERRCQTIVHYLQVWKALGSQKFIDKFNIFDE
ncbi:hypothetical protein F504_2642 [Ralstonia pseudosolanacearum FQY_4]|nr:hypothetical protein F504_2642 [Ralstonia pseudosolanacearum FQY_4]